MPESNTTVVVEEQYKTLVSKVTAYFWDAYLIIVSIIRVLVKPYVFFYNFAKSFFENCKKVASIGPMSIRAVHLYLEVWIKILTGLNKDDKPAETALSTMKNIGTAANNIYKTLLDEPSHSETIHRSESRYDGYRSTFPPIEEISEPSSVYSSGHFHEASATIDGGSNQPPVDTRELELVRPHGHPTNGGSNGSSGGSNGSGSINGVVNGHSKGPTRNVVSDSNVKETGASSTGSSSSSSTIVETSGGTRATTESGVDEVDKFAKTSPKKTTPAGAAGGGAAARPVKA
ncbi:hypothetical protein V9T40_003828 [Parthenolecanium corni]|uniref:Uncharacterized protein n=1 Tax=Parthenolecanium corni TaxID=536013 RepID=A0AAN9YA30_9HEMI